MWNLPHGTYLYGTANGNIYNNIYTIYNYRYIGYIQHSISLRIYIYTRMFIYDLEPPISSNSVALAQCKSRWPGLPDSAACGKQSVGQDWHHGMVWMVMGMGICYAYYC